MQEQSCITVDGTAGAGKTTLGRWIARLLDYKYLETGLAYRALALTVARGKAEVGDGDLVEMAKSLDIYSHVPDEEGRQIRTWVNGKDVTNDLWERDVEDLVAKVASVAAVRNIFTGRQRELSGKGRLVLVGRDAGTTIVPKAGVKFFLDADPNVRAVRRAKELEQITGVPTSWQDILQSLINRDGRDSTRTSSPLTKASDAIFIDTSNLNIDDVRRASRPFIERLRNEV